MGSRIGCAIRVGNLSRAEIVELRRVGPDNFASNRLKPLGVSEEKIQEVAALLEQEYCTHRPPQPSIPVQWSSISVQR